MDISPTDAIAPLAGGALIGAAASLLLLGTGRLAGISGIFNGVLQPRAGDVGWRATFLAGLLLGGVLLNLLAPDLIAGSESRSLLATGLGGVIVGFGVRRGNGCTSGHGVCGVSRLSRRSIVATLTFIGVGMITATGAGLLVGGSL